MGPGWCWPASLVASTILTGVRRRPYLLAFLLTVRLWMIDCLIMGIRTYLVIILIAIVGAAMHMLALQNACIVRLVDNDVSGSVCLVAVLRETAGCAVARRSLA